MSNHADMIILIRDDVLEFAADGKGLGKFKYGEATELYHLIKKSDEIDRPRLINNAYVRLCFEPFELAEATRSTKSPAGDSAGYERVAS